MFARASVCGFFIRYIWFHKTRLITRTDEFVSEDLDRPGVYIVYCYYRRRRRRTRDT